MSVICERYCSSSGVRVGVRDRDIAIVASIDIGIVCFSVSVSVIVRVSVFNVLVVLKHESY